MYEDYGSRKPVTVEQKGKSLVLCQQSSVCTETAFPLFLCVTDTQVVPKKSKESIP